MVFPILPANTLSGGYEIDNSCRFIDSSYLTRDNTTQSGAGDNFTFSAWLKMSTYGDGGYQGILSIFKDSNDYFEVYKDNGSGLGTGSENLQIQQRISGTGVYYQIQHFEFADYSAWYHLVINFNNSESNEVDKVSIYVNGTEIQGAVSNSNPFGDVGLGDSAYDTRIGAYRDNTTATWNGYMADVHLIAGSTLTASSFGETNDDGIWIPKEAKDDLTFGTNGFFLEFKETGTSQNSSGIGADTSGEDNHLAVTNLAATNQTTDTPTNNFATFNPLMTYADIVSNDDDLTFSEGNTKVTGGTGGTSFTPSVSSIGVSNGKWYYEFYNPTTDSGTEIAGAMNYDYSGGKGINDAFIGIRASNGDLYNNGSTSSVGTEWKDSGDILSVKLNMDDDEISFSTNGATYTSAVSITGNAGADGILHPVVFLADDEITTVNFGNPNWALSSGNADANGYGNFEYAVPSGYYAICTKNLAKYG